MNKKSIGIILIVLGIMIAISGYYFKVQEDQLIKDYMLKANTCFLDDGTCLHADRSITKYIVIFSIAVALIIIGIYLIIIDKNDEKLIEHQKTITSSFAEAKKADKDKDEFKAYLAGFNEDQQKIIKAVKEQDGIKQATLRFRTGLSKTTLSLLLKSLEQKGIVKRKESGKSNEVYLVKKW